MQGRQGQARAGKGRAGQGRAGRQAHTRRALGMSVRLSDHTHCTHIDRGKGNARQARAQGRVGRHTPAERLE